MMSKKLVIFSMLMILLMLVSACSSGKKEEGVTKIKISYGSIGSSQAIATVANNSGIFKKNGLDAELLYIAGDAIKPLMSGEVQFTLSGALPVLNAKIQGSKVVMIGSSNKLSQALYAVPSIKEPKDLIGKNLGISKFGTTSDIGTRVALKAIGIDPKQVTILQIGDAAARLAAAKVGNIVAFSDNIGYKAQMEKGGLKLLVDVSNVEFLGTSISTSDKYLQENPSAVTQFAKSIVEAIKFTKQNPKETKDIISKFIKSTDTETINVFYEGMINLWDEVPYVNEKAVNNMIEALKEGGTATTLKANNFFNNEFLKRASGK